MASHPTAADARADFDEWAGFYRDYYGFPARLPADIDHGFDSWKVTDCTVDVGAVPTAATGNLSVPRKAGPLATVAYLHGTSVSFYDAPSNPNISGDVLASLKVRRSGELFTFGFSQGGHAALALQRLLERRGVEVTATAAVGGVFDLERSTAGGPGRRSASTTARTTRRWLGDMLVSVERVRRRGAEVTVRRLPGLDHVNSWVRAMPRAAGWFERRSAA